MRENNIENHIRRRFEADLPSRIRRTKELTYTKVIGAHYFAEASTQCLELYRDGYMLGCIMCCQALIEAILKFVAKRNKIEYKKDVEFLILDLRSKNILSENSLESVRLAWQHRNDFHHLNLGVSRLDLEHKAKECIDASTSLECEIFGVKYNNGALIPNFPLYWDMLPDNTVPAHLRQLDV